MESKIPSFLLEKAPIRSNQPRQRGLKLSFLEESIRRLSKIAKEGYLQGETASEAHFLQKIDARIKVLFLVFFVIIVSIKREIVPELALGAFVFCLVILGRLNVTALYKRVLLCGFFFGFLIALPSACNIITRGDLLVVLLRLSRGYHFWVYNIPKEIGITKQGMLGVTLLTLRVMNSVAISLLVLYTTPFTEIIKALKAFRVPDSFLVIVTLSYKYIFILLKTVEEMYLAKKSRSFGALSNSEGRSWVAGRMGLLFRKSMLNCEEVFKAMLSRGFSDTIRIPAVRKLNLRDWLTGASFLMIGILFILMGK
jgi:cobalt/nickel transport system permease protein